MHVEMNEQQAIYWSVISVQIPGSQQGSQCSQILVTTGLNNVYYINTDCVTFFYLCMHIIVCALTYTYEFVYFSINIVCIS